MFGRIRRAARAYRKGLESRSSKLSLKQARESGELGTRLADTITRPISNREKTLFENIEQWRTEHSQDNDHLVDGSLGAPVDYDQGLTVSDVVSASRKQGDAFRLFSLAKDFDCRNIIELGTNVGVSSAYLRLGQAGSGTVSTFDASAYRLRLAKQLHDTCEINGIDLVMGMFDDTLPKRLIDLGNIDMAFIDGNHHFSPTMSYFDQIYAKSAATCIFVFDDIRWSTGMRQAWAALKSDSRFSLLIDMVGMGVGITNR